MPQETPKNTDPKKVVYPASGESTSARLPIGYPPVELYFSNEVLAGSIPLMYLIPGQGEFVAGLDVFRFGDRLGEFKTMLTSDYDIVLKTQSNCIPIAFLPEAIPGIQLSNDYGASFLESVTGVANPMLGQIGQMVGSSNVREFVTKAPGEIGAAFGPTGAKYGQKISDWITGGAEMLGKLAEKGVAATPEKYKGSVTGVGGLLSAGASVVGAMLMGSRVDFPKVWMGSGFSGPVSIPIRLYNPDQTSEVCYNKYIIEPLTILLMLGAPLSDQDNLYRWPYIHQIWCPGLFKWKMASVVGLTVQPGPENQMSWNSRPSMVDVRIDFQPLHSVMLGRRMSSSVPSVGDYIDQLRDMKKAPRLWDVPAGAPDVSTWSSGVPSDEDMIAAPGTPTSTVDPTAYQDPDQRTSDKDKADAADLQAQQTSSGSDPTADERAARIVAARDKALEEAKLEQAQQTQIETNYADQLVEQKAVQDKELQDQLQASDEGMRALPQTQGSQVANISSGPSSEEIADAADGKIAIPEDSAYIQDEYGAVPGDPTNVPKEIPEGGKTDSFWSGVSSKLNEAGTAVYAAGSKIATSVIDAASAKAKQVSDSVTKATGAAMNLGQSIKTTVTPTPTVEEVRKADTFPTTSEEGVKAETEPVVAASQVSMQARSSEIASENQKYTSDLQVWNSLLEKTTDPATQTFAQTRINLLNTNHEYNLAQIESKYI